MSNYTCFYTNCLTLRVRYCRHFVIAFHSIFVMLERHCRFLDFFHIFLIPFLHTLQACVMFSSNVLLGIPLLDACTPWSWSLLNASKRVTYSCLASLHVSFYLYASATLRAYVIFTSPALYNFSLLSVVWAKMKAKVDGQVFGAYEKFYTYNAHTKVRNKCHLQIWLSKGCHYLPHTCTPPPKNACV